jgi:hypothetical protein
MISRLSLVAPPMLYHFQRIWDVNGDEKTMRTLLRQAATGLYFQGPDQWTNDRQQAHNFKMIDHALSFVARWKLRDLELVFAFENAEEVTRVPIDKMELRYSES